MAFSCYSLKAEVLTLPLICVASPRCRDISVEKLIFDPRALGISGSFSVSLCLRVGFAFPITAMTRDHGELGDSLPLYYPCAISPSLATSCGNLFCTCTRLPVTGSPDHPMLTRLAGKKPANITMFA